jgi:hypothetical protein
MEKIKNTKRIGTTVGEDHHKRHHNSKEHQSTIGGQLQSINTTKCTNTYNNKTLKINMDFHKTWEALLHQHVP